MVCRLGSPFDLERVRNLIDVWQERPYQSPTTEVGVGSPIPPRSLNV